MKLILIALFALLSSKPINDLPDAKSGDQFGTEFTYQDNELKNVENAMDLLSKPNIKSIEGVFKVSILEVCSKKGCWLDVDLGNGITGFVKMEDYGFFLPMNTAGKEVVINGTLYKEEISVKELQHYAEDAGKSKDEIASITKPELKYRLTAKGISVL